MDRHHDCHIGEPKNRPLPGVSRLWRGARLRHPAWRREPPVDTRAATTAPTISKPASDAREQSPAPLAAAQAEANAVVDALAGSPPPPESSDGVPTFDVARIEPTGEAVIAGRAAPGATVELLRNGEVHDRAVADKSGQFVMVPPRLPPGTYDLTLRSKQPDGTVATSKQRVTVALEPRSTERPVVALVTPNKPTVVLSQPGAPKPGTGARGRGNGRDRAGRQVPCERPGAPRRGAEALSQRQLCDVGNGRRGWAFCGHDQ